MQEESGKIRVRRAQQARRCAHIKERDGLRCGSPAMREGHYCYAHEYALSVRPKKLELPPVLDSRGVRSALQEVMQALVNGAIDTETAGKLLYGLQIASSKL